MNPQRASKRVRASLVYGLVIHVQFTSDLKLRARLVFLVLMIALWETQKLLANINVKCFETGEFHKKRFQLDVTKTKRLSST